MRTRLRPSKPRGRSGLALGLESADVAYPEVSVLGAGDAAHCALTPLDDRYARTGMLHVLVLIGRGEHHVMHGPAPSQDRVANAAILRHAAGRARRS
eukprot:2795288-Alexandrium_andersonii.AAC.1